MTTGIEWLEWFVKEQLKRANFAIISIMKIILTRGIAVNAEDLSIKDQG
jgi:hypothetical protein